MNEPVQFACRRIRKGMVILMSKQTVKPFVPADKIIPEFTVVSIIIGALLAVLFGGANAYLGLKVGMTVSASIPAAVISMGIIRVILKRNSILENNMVQTIGSAGESVAAGAIFTMPALFMWAAEGVTDKPSFLQITLIALCGGLLGVIFMVPLRKALIVEEHGNLPYPEGSACADVLKAGEEGGSSAKTVFTGLGIAALYKFIADGLKLFPSEVDYEVPMYKGSGFGVDVLPALAGVGFICGAKISSYLFAGGIVGWFVLMPLMTMVGSDIVLFPAEIPIAQLFEEQGAWGLWSNYIRYVGAGAVAAGGILTLIRTLPLIIKTFGEAIKGLKKGSDLDNTVRTNQDLSMKFIFPFICVIAIAMWLIPVIPVNLIGAIIIIVFGFFFSTVSARMVGLIGSSNNPVSGMAIATMLISTLILKATGGNTSEGMIGAITIGSIICIVASIAGDTSQDLKTGFLLGATPKKQQIGELIGATVAAVSIGGILYLMNAAWGFGSAEIPAPQATLMKMVVEGVMDGNLPWNLVLVGVFMALVVAILGIPVLPFAIGLYLPIHLSVPIMLGGVVREIIRKRKNQTEEQQKKAENNGILYASGLIAGEGLVGITLAVLAVITVGGKPIAEWIDISGTISLGNTGGLIFFAGILLSIYLYAFKKDKKQNS